MTDAKYLTYRDVAGLVGIPLGSLYGKVRRGEIPHLRFGPRTVRFDKKQIESWLQARHVAEGATN